MCEEIVASRRAKRRKNAYVKAKRKQNISRHNFGFDWYDNLHQYADNKIHCSCFLCSSKTSKQRRGRGKDWGLSDMKRVQEMTNQYNDFQIIEE